MLRCVLKYTFLWSVPALNFNLRKNGLLCLDSMENSMHVYLLICYVWISFLKNLINVKKGIKQILRRCYFTQYNIY